MLPVTLMELRLIYSGDPLLRELTTTSVGCRESQSAALPSNGRESKSLKKKAASAPTAPLLEVVLHDTIIFPEGGGQPSDLGILTSSDGELWDVVEAKRIGGHAVHYVRLKLEQKVEHALKVLSPGAVVGVSLGKEGYKRRLDHVRLLSLSLSSTGCRSRPPNICYGMLIGFHAHISTLTIGGA